MFRDEGVCMAVRGYWLTDIGSRTPKHPVRHEGTGGRDTAWLLAPLPSANLLSVVSANQRKYATLQHPLSMPELNLRI